MEFEETKWGITKDFLYYPIIENGEEKIRKKPNTLTLEKIRKQLKEIDFINFYKSVGGKSATNDDLEGRKVPPFNRVFYSYFIKTEKIITPQKMVELYISRYCEKTSKGYHIKPEYAKCKDFYFTYNELVGRICRAYNSYVREVDLLFQLFQRKDIQVKYTFEDDFIEGIDILVKYNGEKKGIACCQNSKRSNEYFVKKHTTRRQDKIDVFKFAISWTNRIVVGDIWLYSKASVEDFIKNKIKGENENE